MEVPDYLCKLLLQHDKVVIPGFGIIETAYAPATIHPTQHLFHPPHKSLSFTRNIAAQDELIAALMAITENIAIDAAKTKIQEFVLKVEDDLLKKGSCYVKGIGKFYFDVEHHLQFLADNTNNFLLSSYGLGDFISPPVLRPEKIADYAAQPRNKEKKKRKLIWFRF